ncbi:hypothetical protein COI97_16010 [Bacillus cereus]|nr:hypothetical protein COI97_16010 [Bacillus cereus]
METVVFRIVGAWLDYHVGQTILFDDGEGKITSIRSVKCLSYGEYEIIGRYKPYEQKEKN